MYMPLVSVIMPSYNTPKEYLREAIMSIITQSYSNFELLIIDDGSKEPIKKCIEGINDERIRILENCNNQGLTYSLNRGLTEARGKYFFRMDADDISIENRIEKQVRFLENNPDVDVVATFAKTFGAAENHFSSKINDAEIKAELLWKNPIVHPTVALRGKSIRRDKILYSYQQVSEDFELWSRLAFEYEYRFAVLPEELLRYRLHDAQITVTRQERLKQSEKDILDKSFQLLGVEFEQDEIEAYCMLKHNQKMLDVELNKAIALMKKVLSCNVECVQTRCLRRVYIGALLKYGMRYKKIKPLYKAITL